MANDWEAQAIAASTPVGQATPQDDWEAQAVAQSTPLNMSPSSAGFTGSVTGDIAKGGVTGLAKGIAGLAGLPMDAVNLARRIAGNAPAQTMANLNLGLNSKGEPIGSNPDQDKADLAAIDAGNKAPVADLPGGGSDAQKFAFSNGEPYQPQTLPGKFAETVGEIAPAVASGTELKNLGIGAITKAMTAGEIPGLLPLAKGVAGDISRVALPSAAAAGGGDAAEAVGLPAPVGQIPALMLSKVPSMMLPNAGRMAKDALGNITPEETAAAQALQQQGQNVGVPLMGQESFNKPALTTMAGNVLASPTGAVPIGNFLNGRPAQVAGARASMLDAIAPNEVPPVIPNAPADIPIPIGPQSAANVIQQAADARLRQVGQMRTDASSPGYVAASGQDIPVQDHLDIIDQARAAAAQAGAGTLARNRLTQLADNLQQNGTNIGLLDSTRKSFRDNLTNAALPDAADSETARLMKPVLNNLRDTMANNSPDFAAGLRAYKDASSSIVEPLQNGPIGSLAIGAGNPSGQLNTLFNPGSAGPSEVGGALKELGLANPNAPAIATRRYVEDASNVPSNMPTQAGARIFNALMGKPDNAANLDAAMRGSELASGQAPGVISTPVNNTLSVFDATRRAPALNSATAGRTAANQQAGSSLAGTLVDAISAEPLHGAAQWLRGNLQRKTYSTLADALTDKDSVNALLKLSGQAGPSPFRGGILSSALLAAQNQISGGQR